MSHDGFHEKIGGETPVFGRSSSGGFWPAGKCFFFQCELTDSLSAKLRRKPYQSVLAVMAFRQPRLLKRSPPGMVAISRLEGGKVAANRA
jgi:hypothetical protein